MKKLILILMVGIFFANDELSKKDGTILAWGSSFYGGSSYTETSVSEYNSAPIRLNFTMGVFPIAPNILSKIILFLLLLNYHRGKEPL